MNNDGKLDIVVHDSVGTASVWLNTTVTALYKWVAATGYDVLRMRPQGEPVSLMAAHLLAHLCRNGDLPFGCDP